MPISPMPSPNRAAVLRPGGIEVAFDRADACERLGDLRLAVDWLDCARDLSGGLSLACCVRRARLAREL